MSLYKADGTRVTKANIATTADPDPLVVLSDDLYEHRRTGREDDKPQGELTFQSYRAGTVLRQSQVDALFQRANVLACNPATGPAAGGTVVTIEGSDLDGVTAVKFRQGQAVVTGSGAAVAIVTGGDLVLDVDGTSHTIELVDGRSASIAAAVIDAALGDAATATLDEAGILSITSASKGPTSSVTVTSGEGTILANLGLTAAQTDTGGAVTAGTAVTVLSDREVQVTTPAGAVGGADLELTDDRGTTVAAGAFRYV